MTDLTIAIAAHNAGATIDRAVGSCLSERGCDLLLVDDRSDDETVARAVRVAGARLRVVRTGPPGGLGCARQVGLAAITTPFAAWLDADDEWVPGRADRLRQAFAAGADIVSDGIDLIDGPTGVHLRRMIAPSFLDAGRAAVRLFERNFLPGDAQAAFRVDAFRAAGGYDTGLERAESMDMLLRAIARGARLTCEDLVGYRMYAYATSLSRDLVRQRAALATALRKHPYETIQQQYADAGYPPRLAAWAVVTVALYRNDPATALRWLEVASPADDDPARVLEPEGPWPFAEGWRRAFTRGTALLMLGRNDQARVELALAERLEPSAEGANNLGIAVARLGDGCAARHWFETASGRLQGYQDARLNLSGQERITSHPLRRLAARSEYPES